MPNVRSYAQYCAVWFADRAGWLALIDEKAVTCTLLHLASQCRRVTVDEERLMADLKLLHCDEEISVAHGFYERVEQEIKRRSTPSFWAGLFEPAFGRRLALASILFLITLGAWLVSREEEYVIGPLPEMILATDKDAQTDANRDRDQMLVNLATYR